MKTPLSALFDKYQDNGWLNRARKYARWTIPALFTETNTQQRGDQTDVEGDFQSIGSMLVNNLAPKLVRLLFPANRAFFGIEVDEALRGAAIESGHSEETVDGTLAQIELDASQRLFRNAAYASLILWMKYLIVAGDSVMFRNPKTHKMIVYGPGQFGLRRDSEGTLLDCVLKDFTTFAALPYKDQVFLKQVEPGRYTEQNEEATLELYTRIKREYTETGAPVYRVYQEVSGKQIGDVTTYPPPLLPYIAPTWSRVHGENYGRGLVGEYAGDFARLSNTSEAGALYEVEILRLVNLVRSGSGTDIEQLARAETGAYVPGDPQFVSAHEGGDPDKVLRIGAILDGIVMRLAQAFMWSANTRDAERVTAYEVQKQAEEVEETLGGVYSSLAEVIQVPLARLLMYEMKPELEPALALQLLEVAVTAGLPRLRRSAEMEGVVTAAQEGAVAMTLTQLDDRVSPHRLMDMVYASRSLDTSRLFKSPEEMRADAEARNALQQTQSAVQDAQSLQTINQLAQGAH